MSANFLTKGTIETAIATAAGKEDARITDIQGLKANYFNGPASLAASYNMNKTFALSFAPTARFALSSINKDAPVKTYLNSIGFASGLNITF